MLMEDKRILRTKAQFRQALITLLDQKRFEQITIKALCDQAGITRITFYAHYADKYELAEDIFREMIVLGTQEYLQLQRKNNPSDDPILGYCNVLDAILDLYTTRFDFFRHTSPAENPYLSSSFGEARSQSQFPPHSPVPGPGHHGLSVFWPGRLYHGELRP